MKIKRLKLNHFRRFTDFELDFHPQLTVLVARNGAGKSSILDAVATSLGAFLTRLPKVVGLNPKETDFQVYANGQRPPYMRITCESVNGIKWDRTSKRDQTPKTASEIPEALGVKALNDYVDQFIDAHNANQHYELPVFIHYGTGRGVFDVPARKSGFGKDYQRFDALRVALESRTNFRSFVEYFYSLEDIEAKKQKEARSFDVDIPELKAIRHAVQKMLPDFSNPRGAEVGSLSLVNLQPQSELRH